LPKSSFATARTITARLDTNAATLAHGRPAPNNYVGRFAPSPTGHLHLGTLTAAVASYLHARQSKGTWLVRLEDIDPPREVAGSASSILQSLEALDLEWDGDVLYQSTRLKTYLEAAGKLVADKAAYYCDCSRQQIRSLTGSTRYPGTCRQRSVPPGDAAIRLRVGDPIAFSDGIQGEIERDIEACDGDYVIVRRDGLPAYHLAVVLDDAWQGVTDVVRGADLVDSTPLHIHLQRVLALQTPHYWHIPLITNAAGQKLSKSAGAAAIDAKNPEKAAAAALALLGLTVPAELRGARPRALWDWATDHWRLESLAGRPGPVVPGE
jgi:glutamyl-Q tRNA(Asp) synthetase